MAEERNSLPILLGASALSIFLSFIPFAAFVVYPFKLFVTFIHEGGHAFAALATLGAVQEIVLHPDTSGVTISRGGSALITASAGYLTSTLYGAFLLLLGRNSKHAKAALGISAAVILGLTFLFMKGFFGWIMGLAIAAGLIFFAALSSQKIAHFFLSFLAVQCCLNALYDLQTLFFLSATTREASDAMNMQRLTLIPAIVWAVLWLGISLIVLWLALKRYFKKSEKIAVENLRNARDYHYS